MVPSFADAHRPAGSYIDGGMPTLRNKWPLFPLKAIALAASASLFVAAAEGLVIYRFGGSGLPPPAEAGEPGVDFVQLQWTDLDPAAGGHTDDIDLQPETISSLRRDPTVDLAPSVEEQGGHYVRPAGAKNFQVWDADTSTVWTTTPYLCGEFLAYYLKCSDDFGTLGTANVNLGSLYEIDRVRVVSGLRNPGRTVQGVRVFIAPRLPTIHFDRPFSPYAAEVRDNRQQVLDIPLPPNEGIGFVQVALQEHTEPLEVHDIQIFAKGFAPQSTYMSAVLDFGQPMAWGRLRWQGSKGDLATVQIQTRSGLDPDPVRYWRYIGRGDDKGEVSGADYGGLSVGEKAGTSYDHGNWSFWATYEFGDSLGVQIVSPSPRRFLQFQVEFLPLRDQGASIRLLEFRASEPVAAGLFAEIWPVWAKVGEWTDFTYHLRPTITVGNPGFDRLEIHSTSLLGDVSAVRLGDAEVPFAVEKSEAHRVVIGFPAMEASDSGALLEVDIAAQVLRYGDRFEGRAWNSTRPLEVPQAVNAGDATGDFEGNRVSVATPLRDRVMLRLGAGRKFATPNGDGSNDAVLLAWELFEITDAARVRVEVVDLSGRRVRLLHEGDQGIGIYGIPWDARDDAGRLAPPGVYVGRVSAQLDDSQVERLELLQVAY